MRTFLSSLFLLMVIGFISANCQPNTSTEITAGIVNPVEGKTYNLFYEIVDDTTTGRLVEGMDFMSPDVSDLIAQGLTWAPVGDTLFTTFTVQDLANQRYIRGGLVQVDESSFKYSAMAVSNWLTLDMIEVLGAGFIFRRE